MWKDILKNALSIILAALILGVPFIGFRLGKISSSIQELYTEHQHYKAGYDCATIYEDFFGDYIVHYEESRRKDLLAPSREIITSSYDKIVKGDCVIEVIYGQPVQKEERE